MIATRTESFAKYLAGILILVSLIFMPAEKCQGYVIPANQLIAFMAKNFSKFQTLVIIQSTQQKDENDETGDESFMERIWMESPDRLRSQVTDHPMGRVKEPDMSYRQVLMANTAQRLAQILSRMGVNLHSVALTRIDGVIAYRIGDKESEQPKILVEKDRFLPLLLVYKASRPSVLETITVQFKDYKKMEEGWYPFEIIYTDGKAFKEIYTIHTLKANVPIDPALFVMPKREFAPEQVSEPEEVPAEEERLRDIIKKFEEKYQ
ncbi:MAG: hypothetical protein AMK69_11695 [Nitrospira bacterium SG8_3]|nr:MAG: hypothetical protein AMK69_11695 [Nitrospira bacterium SG8_3]